MTDKKNYADFAERLNKLIKSKGTTIREISDKTGINYEMVRRYANGMAKPREDKMKLLANFLSTSIAYLDYGNDLIEKPKFQMAIESPDRLPSALREHLTSEHEEAEEVNSDDIPAMLKKYVPVISWVAAGDMTPVMPATLTEVIDWIPRPKHLSNMAFGLIIRGRSMLPEFKPDEIIYVEPKFNPYYLKDGDLVVVACEGDGEATFKQLVFGETSEDMYLKPLNPEWHNQEIRPMTECHLVGRVMGKYVVY